MNRAIVWGLAAAALVAFVLALAGRERLLSPALPPPSTSGEADIGGPFELVDGAGRTVTDADFRGRYMLVFFGFTYCPDVCPTTLQKVANAIELLGEDGEAVTPVFISVDPARDTPEVVGAYVEHFHPRMVGLTGSAAQVDAAAKAYRVYYAKAGGADAGDDYLVDHSSIVYLIGPEGRYLTHFSHGAGAEELAEGVGAHID